MALHVPTDDLILWPGELAPRILDEGLRVSPSLRLSSPWDWSRLVGQLLPPGIATQREPMSLGPDVRTPALTEMSRT